MIRKIIFWAALVLLVGGVVMTFVNREKEQEVSGVVTAVDSVSAVVPSGVPKLFGIDQGRYIHEEGVVKEGSSLSDILYPAGVSYARIDELVKVSRDSFDVRHIRAGKKYHFFFDSDSLKTLKYFVYQPDRIHYVLFSFGDTIGVRLGERPVRKDTVVAEGVINSSLWLAMKQQGIDPWLALELSDVYAWTIDFYGIQKGDAFKVIYLAGYVDSTYIGVQKILAARFRHSGHDYYAFLWSQDGKEDYFDRAGGSLQRTFLKAPLKFSRISSRFSNSRLHPVLKIRRPHHGVDYAAPTGTPVRAIGDGVVVKAAWSGGYGRRVVIKHNSTYTTGYAHLSRYGKGIKAGVKVTQGQVIGYVGMSGLATGPHLDFRFYKNGTPVDPLKVKSPPAIPVRKEYIAEYQKFIKPWIRRLRFSAGIQAEK